eukprot:jgi/Psemu1/10267/gm1.10267_g
MPGGRQRINWEAVIDDQRNGKEEGANDRAFEERTGETGNKEPVSSAEKAMTGENLRRRNQRMVATKEITRGTKGKDQRKGQRNEGAGGVRRKDRTCKEITNERRGELTKEDINCRRRPSNMQRKNQWRIRGMNGGKIGSEALNSGLTTIWMVLSTIKWASIGLYGDDGRGRNGGLQSACPVQWAFILSLWCNQMRELVVDYNVGMASTPPDPQAVKERGRKIGKPDFGKKNRTKDQKPTVEAAKDRRRWRRIQEEEVTDKMTERRCGGRVEGKTDRRVRRDGRSRSEGDWKGVTQQQARATISMLGGRPIAQQQCPLAVTGQWRC